MTEVLCFRCGTGAFDGADVNTNLKRATAKRDGFRSQKVYHHANDAVCKAVLHIRNDRAKQAAAWQKKQNVWWRRLARKVRAFISS